MSGWAAWLEAHDKLAGWAQFFGAMLALIVTYFTAFAPSWSRKRQLRNAGTRLLANGYETIESYHRTHQYGDLHPLPLRQAALTMAGVADEMARFPIYELEGQGSNSLARRLVAMAMILNSVRLAIEHLALECETRNPTADDKADLRHILQVALASAAALITGTIPPHPEPPTFARPS